MYVSKRSRREKRKRSASASSSSSGDRRPHVSAVNVGRKNRRGRRSHDRQRDVGLPAPPDHWGHIGSRSRSSSESSSEGSGVEAQAKAPDKRKQIPPPTDFWAGRAEEPSGVGNIAGSRDKFEAVEAFDFQLLCDKDAETTGVSGRIHRKEFFPYWRDTLKADDEILALLSHGYVPPLSEWPPSSYIRNNRSARGSRAHAFLSEEIPHLIESGAIREVFEKPWFILPLQLVHRDGKPPRLVVDASRQINPFLFKRKVRLPTLGEINQGVERGDYWASLDLKSGYYHLRIHDDYQKLFGIRWYDEDRNERFFVWTVCFLGISDLVRTFTKLGKPLLGFIHAQGIPVSLYIDDFFTHANSESKCAHNVASIRDVLNNAGFMEAKAKSTGPTQRGVFLGLVNDTSTLQYSIPQNKLSSICNGLKQFMQLNRAQVKEVASLYGKVGACLLAVGPSLRLLTRLGQSAIADAARRNGWNSWMNLRPLHPELQYLIEQLPAHNGFPYNVKELVHHVDITIATDASKLGFGAIALRCGDSFEHQVHPLPCGKQLILKRMFSQSESASSSTFRELLALHAAYTDPTTIQQFWGKSVSHLTDNKGVVAAMRKGSSIASLHLLALDVFKQCQAHDIRLQVHWVPRSDPRLQAADAQSRHFDNEDWGIDYRGYCNVLSFVDVQPQIDLFATEDNAKCEWFASKFVAEKDKAVGINAFSLNWCQNWFFYACPPPRLIVPTLRQVVAQKAAGVLIVPRWASSSFWPYVLPDGKHFLRLVVKFKSFRPLCVVGPDIRSTTFNGAIAFDLIMLQLDGNVSLPFAPSLTPLTCIGYGCDSCRH
ncbi:uncharacterized protein LOC131877501 isoform X1 [Tigriopus californicus]|uniref:uncharacterized protein LOC131877501 isoform X1 n=1 Tax=Tigriopus californicus TaxID=6832 RepID=UPI0027DA452A|nr:uncharacterized protein LOC131877501 isoform X1 [Tigriopus californicus]